MFFQKHFWLDNFWLDDGILLIEYNKLRASFALFPIMMSSKKGDIKFRLMQN